MTITIVHEPTKESVDLSKIVAFTYDGVPYKNNLQLGGGNGVVYFWYNKKFQGKLLSGNRPIAFQVYTLYKRYLQEDLELYCKCKWGPMCPSRAIKEAIERWEEYQDNPAYSTYPVLRRTK